MNRFYQNILYSTVSLIQQNDSIVLILHMNLEIRLEKNFAEINQVYQRYN